MGIKIVLSMVAISLGVTGCAKKGSIGSHERKRAPASQADVGLLVEDSSEEQIETLLGAHPEAEVRVLNKEHGLYEVFNIQQTEVTRFVSGKVESNTFFKLQNERPQNSIFSVPGPDGLQLPGLNRCKKSLPGPTALLSVTEPTDLKNGGTILAGQKIKVNGLGSHGLSTPSNLKTVVAILPPENSKLGQIVRNQTEFEFTPDALGLYQAVVVVQEADDSCAMDGIAFLVTSNRPYTPAVAEIPVDAAQLGHLGLISGKEAWGVSEGEGVTIAIVDSGVNYNHPLLNGAIVMNTAEISGNGLDDDGNGFVDDVLGYDFVNGDEFPYDDAGHGSHVAGLAAGRQFGIARRGRILAVKAMSTMGGDIGSVAAGIRYAVDRGAKIINLSLGGTGPIPHPALVSAVDYAESKNVLLVIAAGNGDENTGLGFNVDDTNVWPVSLENENILSVGSFDRLEVLASYSNFGSIGVDVVTPGGMMPFDPLFSATEENPQGRLFVGMSGTSMASPVAAGIAALVMSLRPELSAKDVRTLLLSAGPQKAELASVTVSGRHLDALAAVQLAQSNSVSN